jgi:hypothetical protein
MDAVYLCDRILDAQEDNAEANISSEPEILHVEDEIKQGRPDNKTEETGLVKGIYSSM